MLSRYEYEADRPDVLFAGIAFDKLPNIQAWVQRIAERPAVKRGLAVPAPDGNPVKLAAFAAGDRSEAFVKEKFEAALKTRESVGAA